MDLVVSKDESSRVPSVCFVSEGFEDEDEDVVETEAAGGYRCLCTLSNPEYTGAEENRCSCRTCVCFAGAPTLVKAGVLVNA